LDGVGKERKGKVTTETIKLTRLQRSRLHIYTCPTTVLVLKVVNKINMLGELKRARRLGESRNIENEIKYHMKV